MFNNVTLPYKHTKEYGHYIYEKSTNTLLNHESHLFRIINNYSRDGPKHYLIMYDSSEKKFGFKHEHKYLQSVASYLKEKKEKVTMLTQSNLTVDKIKKTLETINGNEQLIVLFCGHGKSDLLRVSDNERFDISDFPDETILFTSSPKPFQRSKKRQNIIIIGEKGGLTYPDKPRSLWGVFHHLNLSPSELDEEKTCFCIKEY